jgi:hypothetical protein
MWCVSCRVPVACVNLTIGHWPAGARAQLRREAWAKAEESPMGHLNPVPFFHLYALSLPPHQ